MLRCVAMYPERTSACVRMVSKTLLLNACVRMMSYTFLFENCSEMFSRVYLTTSLFNSGCNYSTSTQAVTFSKSYEINGAIIPIEWILSWKCACNVNRTKSVLLFVKHAFNLKVYTMRFDAYVYF